MPVNNFSKMKHSFKVLQIACMAVGLFVASAPAHAGFQKIGFQWVAPPGTQPPASSQVPGSEILSTSPSSMQTQQPELAAPTVISPSAPVPAPVIISPPPQSQSNQAPEVISPIVIEGQGTPPASSVTPMPLEQAMLPETTPPASSINMPPPQETQGVASVASRSAPSPQEPPVLITNEPQTSADNVIIAGAPSNLPPASAPQIEPPVTASDNVIAQSAPPVPTAGMRAPPLPLPPTSLPEMSATAAPQETLVQGFANNVPLAVALREVLPPGYGFSIDQDVDLGTLVSFQGGKPWHETLMGMLEPAGLTMREEGVMIAIGRMQSAAARPPSSAPPPASVPPQEVAANVGSGMSPPPYIKPVPSSTIPVWAGKPVTGPKPLLTQPSVPSLPPPALPPLVSSLQVTASPAVDTWTAARGDTLHKVLETWARRAHAEFEWSAEYDYPLQASVSFTGTFEDAVRSLLSGFEEAHPQPVAELHDNSEAGQMVLVVQTRGNSYTD